MISKYKITGTAADNLKQTIIKKYGMTMEQLNQFLSI